MKVRHSLRICNDRISRDIFAHDKTDFRLRLLKIRRFDHLPQSDHRRLLIFHFDAHRRFSRNRRFDPQALRFQIQSDIVGKPDDTVYFTPESGWISYLVTDGPCFTSMTLALTPKSRVRSPVYVLCRQLDLQISVFFFFRIEQCRRRQPVRFLRRHLIRLIRHFCSSCGHRGFHLSLDNFESAACPARLRAETEDDRPEAFSAPSCAPEISAEKFSVSVFSSATSGVTPFTSLSSIILGHIFDSFSASNARQRSFSSSASVSAIPRSEKNFHTFSGEKRCPLLSVRKGRGRTPRQLRRQTGCHLSYTRESAVYYLPEAVCFPPL